MYASTAVYLVFSFLGFVLPCIAVVPQYHAERIGIFMLIFWNGGGSLLHFLNGIIWRNDALNHAPVFCDITVYFYAAMHGGTFASILCILRRVHILLDLRATKPSAKEKRKMVITDLLITLGIPMIYMVLYYVNASNRANIFEEVGCTAANYDTIVHIVTTYVSALVLALISSIYGVSNVIKIRKVYSEMRATEYFNADETANRYFRVMALSCVDLLFTIPFLIYIIAYKPAEHPWKSWADTKSNFFRIGSVPSAIWRKRHSGEVAIELYRWAPVVTAFVWLIFFGYTSETRRLYGPTLRKVWKITPFAATGPALEPLAFGSVAPQPRRRHGEISDFSGFSTDRGDEDTMSRAEIAVPASLDVESQVGSGDREPVGIYDGGYGARAPSLRSDFDSYVRA